MMWVRSQNSANRHNYMRHDVFGGDNLVFDLANVIACDVIDFGT